jgi:[acyl-carrier-protein] S-malonyltransferase
MLDRMHFRDPDLPVISCLDPVTLTRAEDIRALFRDNHLRSASIPLITEGLERHGVSAYLVVGPSMAGRMGGRVDASVRFGEHSIPVLPVENTAQLDTAVEMLHDLDVGTGKAS